MKIKTVVGSYLLPTIFDTDVNLLLRDGWDLRHVRSEHAGDEIILIAHLERFDDDD